MTAKDAAQEGQGSVADERPIEVLIVDDHPALRAGLKSLVSSEPGMLVQGDVSSGEEAYSWYRTVRPDVVIMDLSMEGYGGIEAIRRIRAFDPDARILVYTVHATDVMLNRALVLGAMGYVSKGNDVDVLLHGVREVAAGRGFVSPDLVPAMVRRQGLAQRSVLDALGDREFHIFLMIAQGQKIGQCADVLNLSEKTVRNYLTQIKAKLNVGDTSELTRLAIKAGLVEL